MLIFACSVFLLPAVSALQAGALCALQGTRLFPGAPLAFRSFLLLWQLLLLGPLSIGYELPVLRYSSSSSSLPFQWPLGGRRAVSFLLIRQRYVDCFPYQTPLQVLGQHEESRATEPVFKGAQGQCQQGTEPVNYTVLGWIYCKTGSENGEKEGMKGLACLLAV